METDDMDILIRHPVPRRRLTVSEYHHLGQVGILGENDRVELLEGQLVEMSPIGPRHALAVDALHESLVMAVAGKAAVRGQNPVTLDDDSEPQPDIAVVRRPWRGYPGAHPGPDDILLLIEVADSSFNVDSGAKLEMYAKAGIREFWIVDLKIDVVHVHRKPSGLTYKSVTTVKPSEVLELYQFALTLTLRGFPKPGISGSIPFVTDSRGGIIGWVSHCRLRRWITRRQNYER